MNSFLITLQKALNQNGFSLKDDQIDQFLRYYELLMQWNSKISLTAHETIEDFIYKDLISSMYINLYIITYMDKFESLIDLGTGQGIPGLVLKILHPQAQITLLDSQQKKISFLSQVTAELGLQNIDCVATRIESFLLNKSNSYDICVFRGLRCDDEQIKSVQNYVHNKGLIFYASSDEKNQPAETQEPQALADAETIFYQIKPKKLKRKIFILKK